MDQKDTRQAKTTEPKAGSGQRSLKRWQELADLRARAAQDEGIRAQLQADPSALFAEHGIAGQASLYAGAQSLTNFEQEIADMNPFEDTHQGVRRDIITPCVGGNVGGVVNAGGIANVVVTQNAALTTQFIAGVPTET